jgi:hypothetical protein
VRRTDTHHVADEAASARSLRPLPERRQATKEKQVKLKIAAAIIAVVGALMVGKALATPANCFCNVNSDDAHDSIDIGLVRAHFNTTELPSNYDVNNTGAVNAIDIGLTRTAFGTPVLTCTYTYEIGGVVLVVFGWPTFYDGAETRYWDDDPAGPFEYFGLLSLNTDGDGGDVSNDGGELEIVSVSSIAGTGDYTVCTEDV